MFSRYQEGDTTEDVDTAVRYYVSGAVALTLFGKTPSGPAQRRPGPPKYTPMILSLTIRRGARGKWRGIRTSVQCRAELVRERSASAPQRFERPKAEPLMDTTPGSHGVLP